MMFSPSYLLIAIGLAAGAQAFAVPKAGAAFFLTNDPSGNKIVSTNIGVDGKVGPSVWGVSTEGRGTHGLGSPIGPDPLFAQGAITLNAKAKILATVNPGSNTVVLFSIDPENPAGLKMIGKPVSSEGEFPVSVAINSEGTLVCVLNGGAVNGVSCFTPDAKLGLVAKPGTLRSLSLTETTPPSGPAGTVSQIMFSADDSKLVASVKGVPPTPGYFATWTFNPDGSLSSEPTKEAPAAGGLLPFSMTAIPGANAILATDPGIGFDIYDYTEGVGTASTRSSAVAIPGQLATCWSSYSSNSGNFYLTDAGTSTITEVHVDSNLKGTIVRQYPLAAGSAPLDSDIAKVGSNSFMYSLASEASSINVLCVDKPGKASVVQTFNFTSAAKAAGISFNSNYLQGMATFVASD